MMRAVNATRRAVQYERKVRLHTQFGLDRGVPIRIDVTAGGGRGEADARVVLRKALESGRSCVEDRGYTKFTLFNAIVAAQSSYGGRLRDNRVYGLLRRRKVMSQGRPPGGRSDGKKRPHHTTLLF